MPLREQSMSLHRERPMAACFRREKNEMSQALSAHGEVAAPQDSAPEKPVKNSVELALDERLALTKFLITMSTEW